MNNYALLIERLDKFIRKYYLNQLIRGALYSIGLVIALFLIFNLLESQFYFSTIVRKLFFFGFIIVSLCAVGYWIILPLFKYFGLGKSLSHEQAATIVGEHFADVKDQLLNILQLKKESESTQSALLAASIEQKTDRIKLVPFKSAINLQENKKYLKYALPPLLILLGVLFINANLITDSTKRIIDNNTEYAPDAPFVLKVNDGNTQVLEYKNHTIEVVPTGDQLPNEVFVKVDGFSYRLQKNSPTSFTYTFRNIVKDIPFQVFAGQVVSDAYRIKVLKKPQLAAFDVQLNYPKYINRSSETLKNIGDLSIPEGTYVKWNMNATHTDSMTFVFGKKRIKAQNGAKDRFSMASRFKNSQPYTIYIQNENIAIPDSLSYLINVVKDAFPTIDVQEFSNEGDDEIKYYAGTASDDYGITSLVLKYSIQHQDGSKEPEQSIHVERPKGARVQFTHNIDFTTFGLASGDKMNYYFEVGDNDGVNGSKKTKSSVKTYEKASIEKLEEMENINDEEIKEDLNTSLKKLEKIREAYEKLRQEMMQKKMLDWKDRQEMNRLIQEQKEIRQKLEDAKEKHEENIKNQTEKPEDAELQEKNEKLSELFKKGIDPEKEELLRKIEELTQKLNKDQSIDQLEKMDMHNDMLQKDMERLLELYKQLDVEKDAKDLMEKMDQLGDKQLKLAEKTQKNPQKEDVDKQEKLNDKMKDIQKKMDDLQEKNEALKNKKDFGENPKDKMKDIQNKMDEAQKDLNSEDKEKNKSAGKKQSEAGKQLKKMAKQMAMDMEADDEDQNQEDAKLLRQILENLLTISFDQEDISTEVNSLKMISPKYKKVVATQNKLKDDFKIVEDSLVALANRNDKIETFVLDKVSEAKYHMSKSIENLKERDTKHRAYQNQRYTMKNLNDLALMLNQSLNAMNGSGSGSGKSSGQSKGSEPSDKLSKMGKQLGKQLGKMMGSGKGGQNGNSAKSFAEAAAKLAAMRRTIEKMQQQRQENGDGIDGDLQKLINDMNNMEIDLVNKRLDKRMLDRQHDIQTRLLQAEKAQNKRGFDNKREGKKPPMTPRKKPPSLEAYLKQRRADVELYKTISPELRPYYKHLVEKYYEALKK